LPLTQVPRVIENGKPKYKLMIYQYYDPILDWSLSFFCCKKAKK